MEIIQDKESATKLSDEERQGLTKMYEAIQNPDNKIEAVYVWEISRLSRRPQTLHTYKDLLYNHSPKIDLRIKDIGLRMLLPNTEELNPVFDLVFNMTVGIAQSEIRQKNDRSKRGKLKSAIEGKYTGGFIKYGYSYDKKTKKYMINESEAEIIKLIYSLYETGKYGLTTLSKELNKRGYNVNINGINKILTSPEYIGGIRPEYWKQNVEKKIHRYNRYYPPIISKEQYDKCRVVANNNNSNIDKSKNIYYANKLIKCSGCGCYLTALKNNIQYQCQTKYSPFIKKECNKPDMININVMDTLLWNEALWMEFEFITNLSDNQLREWNNKILELQNKIDNSEVQYNIIVENKIKEIKKVLSTLGENEVQKIAINETQSEKQRIDQEKVSYTNEIEHLKQLINEAEKSYTFSNEEEFLCFAHKKDADVLVHLNKLGDQEKYDIIHRHIKEVRISKYPDIKNTKKIDIYPFDNPKPRTYYYSYKSKEQSKKIFRKIIKEEVIGILTDVEGKEIETDPYFYSHIEIIERFTRKK
jgi:DNA invertase Pin-like site-specific DNA recombinase